MVVYVVTDDFYYEQNIVLKVFTNLEDAKMFCDKELGGGPYEYYETNTGPAIVEYVFAGNINGMTIHKMEVTKC